MRTGITIEVLFEAIDRLLEEDPTPPYSIERFVTERNNGEPRAITEQDWLDYNAHLRRLIPTS